MSSLPQRQHSIHKSIVLLVGLSELVASEILLNSFPPLLSSRRTSNYLCGRGPTACTIPTIKVSSSKTSLPFDSSVIGVELATGVYGRRSCLSGLESLPMRSFFTSLPKGINV